MPVGRAIETQRRTDEIVENVLRAEPAFVRWAAAEGVSMLGTSISGVVLPLVVYQTTGSAALTGALFASLRSRPPPTPRYAIPLADAGESQ